MLGPQSFDRYAYALNTPTALTDPTGLSIIWGHFYIGACDDLFYAISHAECAELPGPVIDFIFSIGIGGGGGGGDGSDGQSSGDAFLGRPCLDPATLQALAEQLLIGLNQALGTNLNKQNVHIDKNGSGALTVTYAIPGNGSITVPTANLGTLDPAGITQFFHPGGIYNMGGRIPIDLPGGSTSAHVVFHGTLDPGGGTVTITRQIEIHGDVRAPNGDLASILAHLGADTIWAGIGHVLGRGCVVKFQ